MLLRILHIVCDTALYGRPFDFTAALHTYIEVLAIEKAKVTGLKGTAMGNAVKNQNMIMLL